jgi:hypothetical protein
VSECSTRACCSTLAAIAATGARTASPDLRRRDDSGQSSGSYGIRESKGVSRGLNFPPGLELALLVVKLGDGDRVL